MPDDPAPMMQARSTAAHRFTGVTCASRVDRVIAPGGASNEERTRMSFKRQVVPLAALLAVAAGAAASASADPAGKTTLSETIRIAPGTGFHQLVAGPGEPYVTRQGALGRAHNRRAGRRRSMLFFGQVTDVHIRDEMAPPRIEFADTVNLLKDANRPQEALTTQTFEE